MEVVQIEGEEISPTEFGKEQGWCEIKRNTKKAAGDADPAKNQQATPASTEKAAFIQKATQYVRKITMTSRMPNLPTDDKIIVRPRDGFNVSHYQKDRVHCCIRNAAGVGREVAEEDSACLNERQNVIVGHLTGDRKCKAKYKIPYLVKRRQWERRMREEAEAAYSSSTTVNDGEEGYRRHPAPRRRSGNSRSASRESRARSRTRSRTRSRAGSRSVSRPRSAKPRSASTARANHTAAAKGGGEVDPHKLRWMDVASGRAPNAPLTRTETAIDRNPDVDRRGSSAYNRNSEPESLMQKRLDQFESMIQKLQQENARLRNEIATLKGEAPTVSFPPPPIKPVASDVAASTVESVEEVMEAAQDAHPAPTKRKALDPEQANVKSQKREEKLRERVDRLDDKVDAMMTQHAQQTAQLNNAIAQQTAQTEQLSIAISQLTKMVATLQTRIDNIEMRLPGAVGRPVRTTGKP
ncbi:hypothetical protein HPB52_007863 [Rhipicephalus sanguineus]|uniref:Uncharacterized protein n=1 Tax=Rhipicephalus sanguineus TaxID=34632 RepID=A0A9D4Q5L5_RHISA|nr:hypothetical protein HPB52_007863 [Rhipicephalus sanguineus]